MKSLSGVWLVIWQLNVARCLCISFTIEKTVATELKVNKSHLSELGVCTDNFCQLTYDIIELVVVDVLVML